MSTEQRATVEIMVPLNTARTIRLLAQWEQVAEEQLVENILAHYLHTLNATRQPGEHTLASDTVLQARRQATRPA